MVGTTAWLLAIFIVGVYLASLYNQFVTLRHNVRRAWSNIDVLLKQRHDEIPKLVEVCKQYRQFEQETLQRVRSSLDSLPPRDVTILGLHYVEDLTYQEIAETLHITPSRVCQLLWRAVERVRAQLTLAQEAA